MIISYNTRLDGGSIILDTNTNDQYVINNAIRTGDGKLYKNQSQYACNKEEIQSVIEMLEYFTLDTYHSTNTPIDQLKRLL